MGGVAVSCREELIEAVLGKIVGGVDDGDFDGQPPEPRAAGEHQQSRNRFHAALQVGEPLAYEIATRKRFEVKRLSHIEMVPPAIAWLSTKTLSKEEVPAESAGSRAFSRRSPLTAQMMPQPLAKLLHPRDMTHQHASRMQ